MDHHRALRILALQGVVRDRARDPERPSSVDFQRLKMWMWYSETFSTPLHHVADLPEEDIEQAYYQWHYQQMSEEDLDAEIKELTATGEKATALAGAGNLDEMGTFKMEEEIEDEDTLEEAYRRAKAKAKGAADVKGAKPAPAPAVKAEPKKTEGRGAEADLPSAVESLGKKIEMTFVSLAELERLEAEDGIGGIEPLPPMGDD